MSTEIPGRLPPPTSDLNTRSLPLTKRSGSWFRSHAIERSAVHYGRNKRFRFDDPQGEYGVLYIAADPFGAFIETFGQFISKTELPRRITSPELSSRALTEFVPDRDLVLVDFTGPGLAHVGADARLFAGDYRDAMLWSKAIHDHPAKVDGILYRTRHDPNRVAAAVFCQSLKWVSLSAHSWLSLGLILRDILNAYQFALIETQVTTTLARKEPGRQMLLDS